MPSAHLRSLIHLPHCPLPRSCYDSTSAVPFTRFSDGTIVSAKQFWGRAARKRLGLGQAWGAFFISSVYQSPPLSSPLNVETLPVNNLASRFVPLTADRAATRFAPHRTTATLESFRKLGRRASGQSREEKKMHHWGTLFWGLVPILIVLWLIGMTGKKSEKGATRSREYPSL